MDTQEDHTVSAQGLGFTRPVAGAGGLVVEQSRAVAEIQSGMVLAKRFPRDEFAATQKILDAFKRPSLAEGALYGYPRGNKLVSGLSIRAVEVMAHAWGNLNFGVRELSQGDGVSLAQSFCHDLETNTREVKEFHVKHIRHTANGQYKLTDPRDIYELVASSGARRKRACVLGIIPLDIQEAAIKVINETLKNQHAGEPIEQRIKAMVKAFASFKVTKEQIESRLGHNVDATTEAELVILQSSYKSIKDGFTTAGAMFGSDKPPTETTDALTAELNAEGDQGIKDFQKDLEKADKGK